MGGITMKKRLISLLLLGAMLLSLLPLSACGRKDGETVSRGEWIAMLAETFGFDQYQSQLPYYSDVDKENPLFPSVQSAAEWQVLCIFTGESLDPEQAVTKEEVASTAALSAGCPAAGTGEDYDSAPAVDYAVEKQIIDSDKDLKHKMTLEECEAALEAARTAYLTPSGEERAVVAPAEDLVDMGALPEEGFTLQGRDFIIPGEYAGGVTEGRTAVVETAEGPVEVSVGETFVTAPTAEHPAGVAYKVAEIREEADGTLTIVTESPTLEDLFDELDVHMTVEADPSMIIWDPAFVGGASPVADGQPGSYTVTFLSAGPQAEPLKTWSDSFSKDFSLGSGNFEKNWSSKNSSALGGGPGAQALENSNFVYDKTPSIEDFGGSTDSWKKNLTVENKFSGGYKITGNISINSLTVSADVQYKKFLKIPYGIENASVQVSSDLKASLKLEGNLHEELRIAIVPIPIAATGLSVSVELFLYVDASGQLQVRAGLGANAKVEYQDGRLRRTASSNAHAETEAAIEMDFGAKLRATLDALSVVKIMDADVSVGGNLTASAYIGGNCEVTEEDGQSQITYKESMNIQADLYLPIIKITCGGSGTLIEAIGLSGNWTVISKDKAAHFELLNYSWVFWEETVTIDKDGNVIDSETSSAGENEDIGASDDTQLDLKSYTVTLRGDSVQLELDLPAGTAVPDVVWTSDNPSVATVDASGIVSPVSTGTATITVSLRSDPNVYVKCAVYVEEIGEDNWEFLPASYRFGGAAEGTWI